MEEIRSTETLDREILEEARKKAYRILKSAEESVKTAVETWALKTETDIAEIRSRYAQRLKVMKDELFARLILDKRRIRAEKIEGLLKSAMESYLRSLSREALLSILERTLRQRLDFLRETGEFPDQTNLQVQSCNLEAGELERMLHRHLPKGSWSAVAPEPGKPDPFLDARFPAVAITAPDLRIAASLDSLAGQLLEDNRAELAVSLVGEEILLEGGAI
ncbi:MAG: ATPase [Spirochaetaceae bacterium]|jgi:vacuolar-type H+-ATPase subunit E/Vma4|nr:ATPase [Spirochaetaceae bacterium]